MCDTSGPNTGAALSLKAIGQQDTYLLGGGESPFDYKPSRHSNFRKFHRSFNIIKPVSANSKWPFDQSVKVTLNPRNMGDLLCNMYVKIDLPSLSGGTAKNFSGNQSSVNYADNIGRHLFKSINIKADEVQLEKYFDDWGVIYDDLYQDLSEKRTNIYTHNRFFNKGVILDDASAPATISRSYKSTVYIPLPFFFSRKYESDDYVTNNPNRPYLPLCAMHKQKLEIEFDFRPQSFFTNITQDISLDYFDIVTEEITLEPAERLFYTSRKYTMITDMFMKHPVSETEFGESNIVLQLVPKNRVKSIHWFFRNRVFEDQYDPDHPVPTTRETAKQYYQNRYNLTKFDEYTRDLDSLTDDVMLSATMYINGQDLPNVSYSDNIYYKNLVTFENRLSTSTKNIYSYTFSMNPRNVEPSGSLDFSQIKSNRTILDIQLDPNLGQNVYTLHTYYRCYQTFTFEDGYISTREEAPPELAYSPEVFNILPPDEVCKVTY